MDGAREPGNAHLTDIFKSMLTNTRGDSPPSVVIYGQGNVYAPGGTVHIDHIDQNQQPGKQAARRTHAKA